MTTMKVFFATNRNMISDENGNADQAPSNGGPRFGIHPCDFRVGTAKVDIKTRELVKGTKVDDEACFVSAKLAKETYDNETKEFTKKGSDKLLPELMGALHEITNCQDGSRKKRSALVFIPGFLYSFRDSIERGALLAHLYSTETHELVPFVFSWPSDGDLFAYDDDRRDARLSGEAAGRAFRTFARYLSRQRRDGNCISAAFLIAHSMGAYALRHAVQKIIKKPEEVFQLFDVAVLPAADEERDALERGELLQPLSRLAGEVVVYTNRYDKPLKLAVSPPRMGHRGPPPRTGETFGAPITVVRCEDVDRWGEDLTRHQYYRMSPEVVRDISAVLNVDLADSKERLNRQEVEDGSYRLVPYSEDDTAA